MHHRARGAPKIQVPGASVPWRAQHPASSSSSFVSFVYRPLSPIEPSSFHRSTISRIVTWPRNHFTLAASYNARVVSDVVSFLLSSLRSQRVALASSSTSLRTWLVVVHTCTHVRTWQIREYVKFRASLSEIFVQSFEISFKIKDLETFVTIQHNIQHILCFVPCAYHFTSFYVCSSCTFYVCVLLYFVVTLARNF